MSENSYSDDSLSDDEEDLDPRIQVKIKYSCYVLFLAKESVITSCAKFIWMITKINVKHWETLIKPSFISQIIYIEAESF